MENTTWKRIVLKTTEGYFHKLAEYAEMVKFEHTIFALPFALSAMILATAPFTWPSPLTVLWVLMAMVGGRTYAMAINRLIDATIDGENPRTRGRSIPAGRVSKSEAWGLVIASGSLLVISAFQLPLICQILLPVAFFILTLYSFVKRFSSLAHVVLGVALGSSAVGGWLAVSGEITWLSVLFGFIVVFWVSGFDVIYACQDYEFDKSYGLYSIPVALGISGALVLSRVFHLMTLLLMGFFGYLYPETGFGYWLAFGLTTAMLIYEHRLVSADNLSNVNEAFFTVNGRISVSVFLCILLDKGLSFLQQ